MVIFDSELYSAILYLVKRAHTLRNLTTVPDAAARTTVAAVINPLHQDAPMEGLRLTCVHLHTSRSYSWLYEDYSKELSVVQSRFQYVEGLGGSGH